MKPADNLNEFFKNAAVNTNPRMDKAVLDKVLAAHEKTRSTKPALAEPTLWRTIMKSPLTKLAAAAIVVVACVIGLSLWRGTQSGIALADVLARVEQVKAFRSTGSYTLTEQMPSGEPYRFETRSTSLTSEYGFMSNVETPDPNGEWRPLGGMYVFPQKKTLVQTSAKAKRYIRVRWDDPEAQRQQKALSQSNDPGALLKGIMACKYEKLGRTTIDGVDVEGFHTTDPNCSSQLTGPVSKNRQIDVKVWVDVKTRLPVRYESLTSGLNERGNPISYRFVEHDFQWDVPVTAADFEPPPVPDGYEVVDRPGAFDEKAAIEGLKQCIELFGSYITVSESERPAVAALWALEKSETPAALQLKGEMKGLVEEEKLNRVRIAGKSVIQFILLYRGLVREKKDPAYYGKTVTPKDADKVLLRWKLSDNEYRVIFGDLHAETVTPERLAELEKALPK